MWDRQTTDTLTVCESSKTESVCIAPHNDGRRTRADTGTNTSPM